jgi:hypothetical protein
MPDKEFKRMIIKEFNVIQENIDKQLTKIGNTGYESQRREILKKNHTEI